MQDWQKEKRNHNYIVIDRVHAGQLNGQNNRKLRRTLDSTYTFDEIRELIGYTREHNITMSAAFSAVASLIPSPVIATISWFFFS